MLTRQKVEIGLYTVIMLVIIVVHKKPDPLRLVNVPRNRHRKHYQLRKTFVKIKTYFNI